MRVIYYCRCTAPCTVICCLCVCVHTIQFWCLFFFFSFFVARVHGSHMFKNLSYWRNPHLIMSSHCQWSVPVEDVALPLCFEGGKWCVETRMVEGCASVGVCVREVQNNGFLLMTPSANIQEDSFRILILRIIKQGLIWEQRSACPNEIWPLTINF